MVDVSFEFFPPPSTEGRRELVGVAQELADLKPTFMSVTYGAGGTSQDRTLDTLDDLLGSVDAPIAGHLTTVSATRSETQQVIDTYRSLGISHIVALRGDTPADQPADAEPTGYRSAAELVAGIRNRPDGATFEISVAAYPEVHPRAESARSDIENLMKKFDAGADRAITQFFFDTDAFLRFRDQATSAGIEGPIVPGIMPIANFNGIRRFAKRCGTVIPPWLVAAFDGLDDDPEIHQLVAATVAAEQCQRLRNEGVETFHFYTMNRRSLSAATIRSIGTTPLSESRRTPS